MNEKIINDNENHSQLDVSDNNTDANENHSQLERKKAGRPAHLATATTRTTVYELSKALLA